MTDGDRILVAKHKRAIVSALAELVTLVGATQTAAFLSEVCWQLPPIANRKPKTENPPVVLTGPGGDFTQAHNFEPRSAEPMIVGAEAQV